MAFAQDDNMNLRVVPPGRFKRRVSVVVPVRVAAKATLRNRLRRRVRETARLLESRVRPGCRLVITLRSATLPDPGGLKDAMVLLMRKSGILSP